EELERALLACWASYWSARALSYQLTRGLRLDGMGVVVQRQVPSRLSGVLFTETPGRGGRDGRLVAEYCFGHGDVLVSGRLNPGRFTVSRADLRWEHEAAPDQ